MRRNCERPLRIEDSPSVSLTNGHYRLLLIKQNGSGYDETMLEPTFKGACQRRRTRFAVLLHSQPLYASGDGMVFQRYWGKVYVPRELGKSDIWPSQKGSPGAQWSRSCDDGGGGGSGLLG